MEEAQHPNDDGSTPSKSIPPILVISDLHLGEACKDHSRIEYLKRGHSFDDAVCSFLDHHARHHHPAGPWCLVLGGDLLDYLQVTVSPHDSTPKLRKYGLGNSEAETVWKTHVLTERHRDFFVHLADFIGCGHTVRFIRGNHDEDLFWPEAKAALVDSLVNLYFGAEGTLGERQSAFRSRVHFHDWFYLEKGHFYMEHGHRFDEYCATPPQLAPRLPKAPDRLTMPLSAVGIRYFANLQPGFSTHDKEHWGFTEYYAYFRSSGVRGLLEQFTRFVNFLWVNVSYFHHHGRHDATEGQAQHEEALKALEKETGVSPETLRSLDGLSVPSVTHLGFDLVAQIFLFEMFGLLLAPIFGVLCLILTGDAWLTFSAFALTVLGVGLMGQLARKRISKDVYTKLRRAAEVIAPLLDVPVVVFGHTHAPRFERLPHDHLAYYINSGSFLGAGGAKHGVDSPCTCGQSFVRLDPPSTYERTSPELLRWCRVNRTSSVFPTKNETH